MKNRSFIYLTSLFIVGLCSIHSLWAQEEGFMFGEEDMGESVEIPTSPGSERVYHRPVEIKPTPKPYGQPEKKKEESKTHKPVNVNKDPKPESKPVIDTTNKEEDPDSVLSFNFLYYIIHKFKFSDVIDE